MIGLSSQLGLLVCSDLGLGLGTGTGLGFIRVGLRVGLGGGVGGSVLVATPDLG